MEIPIRIITLISSIPHLFVAFIPFIAYWGTCVFLDLLGVGKITKAMERRNTVPKLVVLKNTMLVTFSEALVNLMLWWFGLLPDHVIRLSYLLLGIIWVDTAGFFTHLLKHRIPSLYLHHKEHHRIHCPYPYGALYNDTIEATLSGAIIVSGFVLMGFGFREYVIVTTLGLICTVLDHTHMLGGNFHYIHHERDINKNFQKPFFTYWDRLFGTYAK